MLILILEKNRKFFCINSIAEKLGYYICNGMLFFMALTGCDTTSSIFGYSKQTCFDVWYSNPEITQTFMTLSWNPNAISESHFSNIENFFINLYDLKNKYKTSNIDSLRFAMFSSNHRNEFRKLPHLTMHCINMFSVQHIKLKWYGVHVLK